MKLRARLRKVLRKARNGTKLPPALLKAMHPDWHQRAVLMRALDSLRVDCVFDVGANEGQFGQLLREVGFKGTILSFEPNPECYRELERRASADGSWRTFNCALGSRQGEMDFNIMASSLYSSFREPRNEETTAHAEATRILAVERVAVQTLGILVPELRQAHGFRRPLLKTDTQGFDIEVFRGAGAAQQFFVGLRSEVAVTPIYEDVPDLVESIREYQAGGFDLMHLSPVAPDQFPLVELDCYMVNRSLDYRPPSF